MTPEEQDVAIAKACGWTVEEKGWWSHPTLPCNGGAEPFPPEYTNDLNAIREAVKMLPFSKRKSYRRHLQKICSRVLMNGLMVDISECIDATAEQRAEAFLLALDIWVEA